MRERPAGKAFGRVGVQARCMESHLHCSIQWGRQSAALPGEAPGARENTSSVVSAITVDCNCGRRGEDNF